MSDELNFNTPEDRQPRMFSALSLPKYRCTRGHVTESTLEFWKAGLRDGPLYCGECYHEFLRRECAVVEKIEEESL